MAELSVMILCGPSPRHIYVANRLTLAARPVAIVQETGTKWTLRKVVKTLKPGEFSRKAGRWLRDRRRYAGNKEAEFFFEDRPPIFIREELVTRVPYINHPKVTELARQRNPDVIAVFGTTLIKPPLLGQGRLGMVNLHGGLSPEYRGADCTFWALYNGEPEKVGCTLHYIDAGIDTGRLIAHVCPEVKPADDGEQCVTEQRSTRSCSTTSPVGSNSVKHKRIQADCIESKIDSGDTSGRCRIASKSSRWWKSRFPRELDGSLTKRHPHPHDPINKRSVRL
jgi:hypothetical protein